MSSLFSMPHSLLTLFLFLIIPHVFADPATLDFTDCFESADTSQKLDISTVYAQVLESDQLGTYMNLTVIGTSPQQMIGFTNESTNLATLFTSTSVLTLNVWTNSSYLCSALRPSSPLPQADNTTGNYCPLPAGPFALSSAIPWGKNRALTTLDTRLRAVDPLSQELFCLDVLTTPLAPKPGLPYGTANIILWATVGLTAAYWIIIAIARIASAWGRGITRPDKGIWARAQSAGFIIASAISGERLATSPALMRFSTPSMRDVIFHTQWCSALAMIAVQWPAFAYPLLTQTAWSTLSYNITILPHSVHWNPLSTVPYNPPSNFADQLSDSSSPLFIKPDTPNLLFTLPQNATRGIASFAYTIGLRPQDLFSVCLTLFLSIVAAAIIVSSFFWLVDQMGCLVVDALGGNTSSHPAMGSSFNRLTGTRSPAFPINKDSSDSQVPGTTEETKSLNSHTILGPTIFRPASKFTLPMSGHGSVSGIGERGINSHRSWWRIRSDISSFHSSVLHGNLVRLVVLFHLPVTIFSCYQMTLPRSHASILSIALAAVSFSIISVLIPAHLVLRVTFTTTNKLYDETRTLLSLGPLYNHYRHGSQMFASLFFATNLAFGVTIGAGQRSGTAQAIVILVVEVASALVTSVWLPWGTGASMGLISFLFCVARIVVAVLLVILTPSISIGTGAGGWVAYGILVILALVYLALLLMLLVKLCEGFVRIVGGIGFDRSRHVVDSGLLGACGLWGCCGPRKRSHRSRRAKPRPHHYTNVEIRPLPGHRDSDMSSDSRPQNVSNGAATPPKFLANEPSSRKGSTHSGPPPSVLRPEHALRPYKEESDDENGYIMGAWQPYPRPGYAPVVESPSPTALQKPHLVQQNSSGFSRVGGGRAHIDTPYAITAGAIASGSTHTFPSLGQQSTSRLALPVFFDEEDSPPPVSNVGRTQEVSTLPAGAMQAAHIRTKSQSAVIENTPAVNASFFAGSGPSPLRAEHRLSGGGIASLHPPHMSLAMPDDDDDDSEVVSQPKKKTWFPFRRQRAQSGSEPGAQASSAPPVDEELGGAPVQAAAAQPVRSFVVVRKPQPTPGRPGATSHSMPTMRGGN